MKDIGSRSFCILILTKFLLSVSFGGIAGLFLGFSLLSGVEIIYYFTIRAYFMILKERSTLEKIYEQDQLKPKPKYDLSLTPYFISAPLPGNGYNEIRKEHMKKMKKNRTRVTITANIIK